MPDRLPRYGLVAAVAVFVLDQLTKWAVTGPLGIRTLGDVREVTGFFALRFVPNVGVSLGLLPADAAWMRWGLVVLTGAIAAAVAVWMTREGRRWDQLALGLVLGGAMGNIVDRVRFGWVVDFADLHFGAWRPFLVFNLADAAISAGVAVLVIRALVVRDVPREEMNA